MGKRQIRALRSLADSKNSYYAGDFIHSGIYVEECDYYASLGQIEIIEPVVTLEEIFMENEQYLNIVFTEDSDIEPIKKKRTRKKKEQVVTEE